MGAMKKIGIAVVLAISCVFLVRGSEIIGEENFENGLARWSVESSEQVAVIQEPDSSNHVLLLTPLRRGFVHTVFEPSRAWGNSRVEGRFLFPVDGDGYLGFIYNLQQTKERLDFGCGRCRLSRR